MLRILIALVISLSIRPQAAEGQTTLPPCPVDVSVRWHNCIGKYETALSTYVGAWVDNKKDGEGTYIDSDGQIYVGGFLNDNFQGHGALFASNGALIKSGTWQAGVLIQNHSVDYSFPKALKKTSSKTNERRDSQRVAEDPLRDAKRQCRDLGFKDKTEKFGTCVLELNKKNSPLVENREIPVSRGDGSADDTTCAGYGYSVGSTGYADCRMKLDQARRDYERELRAYQAEKAAYDQRVAEGQAEARRRQQERQAQYGFCVAACSSQPGSTALGCMSRCGAASAGLSFDPGAPPARPSGRTTYVINGRIINCNSSPSGSIVTCN